jgi:hypothetical protein
MFPLHYAQRQQRILLLASHGTRAAAVDLSRFEAGRRVHGPHVRGPLAVLPCTERLDCVKEVPNR